MPRWTRFLLVPLSLALLGACGGADQRAEATWETHTTAPDEDDGETTGSDADIDQDPSTAD